MQRPQAQQSPVEVQVSFSVAGKTAQKLAGHVLMGMIDPRTQEWVRQSAYYAADGEWLPSDNVLPNAANPADWMCFRFARHTFLYLPRGDRDDPRFYVLWQALDDDDRIVLNASDRVNLTACTMKYTHSLSMVNAPEATGVVLALTCVDSFGWHKCQPLPRPIAPTGRSCWDRAMARWLSATFQVVTAEVIAPEDAVVEKDEEKQPLVKETAPERQEHPLVKRPIHETGWSVTFFTVPDPNGGPSVKKFIKHPPTTTAFIDDGGVCAYRWPSGVVTYPHAGEGI